MTKALKKITAVITIILLTIFSSCETEKDFLEGNQKTLLKEKSFNELLLLNSFNAAYTKIQQEKQKSIASRSALEDEFNFTISEKEPVNVVEIDGVTYYNILIQRDEAESGFFENLLIINETIDEVLESRAYIVKYIPTGELVETIHNSYYFEGEKELTQITGRISGRCNHVCSLICTQTGTGASGTVYTGPHLMCGDCSGSTVNLECSFVCTDADGGGSGGAVSTGGGGGTTTGGADTVTTPSNETGNNEIIVAPVLPEFEDDVDAEQANLLKAFNLSLTAPQKQYLINNPSVKLDINNYLSQNILNGIINTQAVAFAKELINALINNPQPIYTTTNYPGINEGKPFQWWKDENYINANCEDPYESWKTVSKQEKLLIKNFPEVAYRIYQRRDVAMQTTFMYFGNVPGNLNGKADAFRHAYFQAINTAAMGVYTTKLFSDAHESETPDRWIKEKQMDLYNNQKGMDLIAINQPTLTDVNLISIEVHNLVVNGQLVYLSPLNYNSPSFWDNPNTSVQNDGNHGILINTELTPTDQ
ncbi:hypothetical protein [Flavobacterium sp. GT3R68]|uniref:DUF6973 domain-containing protein n=1 Tax=Flavobacterium sp. GT3R68 TaxID=2594437 RepID=UPI000F87FE87|nr:hypothetical protein [Flavobacterium sp. GT3R68]RTY86204.1 hypothetical protein EKL32_27965 [Flavobacterium sp. GSN2]TRW94016.1 hypothetical protein FNW07_03640 [Flavobacterium sp. GT3R68]